MGAYRSGPETASTDAEVAQLAAAARSRAAANYDAIDDDALALSTCIAAHKGKASTRHIIVLIGCGPTETVAAMGRSR